MIHSIELKNLTKTFQVGYKKQQSLLEKIIMSFTGTEPKRSLCVLNNISIAFKKGTIIGIMGDNGSGKSTLLRIIAGIYQPTMGTVITQGHIVSLINLYAGLQERLTMHDNIQLCCALFGLTKEETKLKYQRIVEFSGLAPFTQTKTYQFSNGMLQRLAFSIAIHCRPDILLLDEVFEVGDEDFKKKSAAKIKELANNGSTIIVVSHDLELIKKYTTNLIWIKNGVLYAQGPTKKVLSQYTKAKSSFLQAK